MAWNLNQDTRDNMTNNRWQLYNSAGSAIKYGIVDGIVEARANDGRMFNGIGKNYVYQNIGNSWSYTNWSLELSDDKTVITLSADRPPKEEVPSWNGWVGLIFTTVPYVAPEPEPEPEPEKIRALTDTELTTFTNQDLIVKVDGEVADSSTEYHEDTVITIHSPDMREIVETAGYPITRVDNPNYDDWMMTENDYDDYGNPKYSDIYVTITDWYDLDLSTLNIKLYKKPPTFTQDLIDHYRQMNLTLSINDEPVNSDDNYDTSEWLDIIADDGFTIDGVQSDILDDDYNIVEPPIIEADSKSAHIRKYEVEWLDQFIWDIVSDEVIEPDPEPEPDPELPEDGTFPQGLIDYYRLMNLTLYINDEIVNSVDTYSTSDRLDIVADDGFTIIDIESNIKDEFLNIVDPPVIANDSKSAYISDYKVEWLDKFIWDIDFPVEIEPELPDEGGQTGQATRGALEVYSMNPDDVRQFTTDFHGLVFRGQTTIVDYSQYILNLITLPFTIQDSLIQESDVNVKLGDKKTKYIADRLKIDTLNYNVGEISVPNVYDNLLDIANTTTILHLPFITPIVLETQYVVGYTIQVEFVINLTNSDCDINIRTSGLDEGNGFGLITSTSVNLNTKIPWGRVDDYVPTNDPSDLGIVTDNGVKQAYIELIRNKPTNINGLWTIPVSSDAILSDATGYIEVSNIDLVSSAPRNEKSKIIDMLEDGVIIK